MSFLTYISPVSFIFKTPHDKKEKFISVVFIKHLQFSFYHTFCFYGSERTHSHCDNELSAHAEYINTTYSHILEEILKTATNKVLVIDLNRARSSGERDRLRYLINGQAGMKMLNTAQPSIRSRKQKTLRRTLFCLTMYNS